MGASLQIDVSALEQFLKANSEGEEVVKALRYRTMIHWLHPELDRLSNRMLPVYTEVLNHLQPPFSIIDVGCMCGWLKHFIAQEFKVFNYVGCDIWEEALTVAKEFDPSISVYQRGVFDHLPGPLGENPDPVFDYAWISNIQFGDDAPRVIEKLVGVARKKAFFGMPDYCGDYAEMADKLGFTGIKKIDCGEAHGSRQSLVIVNGNHDIRGTSDSS